MTTLDWQPIVGQFEDRDLSCRSHARIDNAHRNDLIARKPEQSDVHDLGPSLSPLMLRLAQDDKRKRHRAAKEQPGSESSSLAEHASDPGELARIGSHCLEIVLAVRL